MLNQDTEETETFIDMYKQTNASAQSFPPLDANGQPTISCDDTITGNPAGSTFVWYIDRWEDIGNLQACFRLYLRRYQARRVS